MKVNSLFFVFISIFLFSCSAKKDIVQSANSNQILDFKWQIVEISNSPIKNKVNGTTPTLFFDKNNYSVITGCNTLNGEVKLSKGNQIEFSQGISTMMYCDDMSVEDGFKRVLSDLASYKLEGDYLLLLGKSGKPLVKLKKRLSSDDLKDTNWTLDLLSISGADTKVLFEGKYPTLSFGNDAMISGNASCNNYRAKYEVNGNSIRIGDIASNKMMCPNIKGEDLYLETLKKVNRYSVSGNTLTLIIGDIAVMRFHKK